MTQIDWSGHHAAQAKARADGLYVVDLYSPCGTAWKAVKPSDVEAEINSLYIALAKSQAAVASRGRKIAELEKCVWLTLTSTVMLVVLMIVGVVAWLAQ